MTKPETPNEWFDHIVESPDPETLCERVAEYWEWTLIEIEREANCTIKVYTETDVDEHATEWESYLFGRLAKIRDLANRCNRTAEMFAGGTLEQMEDLRRELAEPTQ